MAILFYEGLPRAGKSYEAMVTQIIPWLQKGKHVVAYIEGLNFERIAEAAQLDVDSVRELLHPLTREDMRPREVKDGNGKVVKIDGTWIEKTMDNALHVYDEAQNWWPNKLRATEQLTQFVTEHGHRGITLLLMGQSLKDVLALWRRRVDQKFVFLKLTALGKDNRYRVAVYKGQGNDEFVKVTDKFNKYDPKYFGTYASHVSGETDTETYTDNRVSVFKTGAFKYGIPLVIALAVWGGFKAWGFFHPDAVKPKPGSASMANATPAVATVEKSGVKVVAVVEAPPPPPPKTPEEAYFADLTSKARARLAGYIQGAQKRFLVVEWLDSGTRVIERLSLVDLEALGVVVTVRASTVKLAVGDWSQIVTMWPVEAEGRVSEYRNETVKRQSAGIDAGVHPVTASPGLVFMDGAKPSGGFPAPVAPEPQPQRVGVARR